MNAIYLIGGRQKDDAPSREEWHAHKSGVIVRLDLDTGRSERVHEYVSPPDVVPDEQPSVLFKTASLRDGVLNLCTQTEILRLSFPSLELLSRITLPCFNDVHHVNTRADGHLIVANTGLDMVLELTPDGETVREWSVLGEDPWARFDRGTDYRKVATTKPHASHPNHVFELDGAVWATRFEQRDAVNLDDPADRIAIDVQRPHDGRLHEGRLWFTTVDGHLIAADPAARAVTDVYDLSEMDPGLRRPGWCRGVKVLDETNVLVAFTRLRPTKWTQNLSWTGGRGMLVNALHRPARVALYDLKAKRHVRDYEVESSGLNAIFSIHTPDEA